MFEQDFPFCLHKHVRACAHTPPGVQTSVLCGIGLYSVNCRPASAYAATGTCAHTHTHSHTHSLTHTHTLTHTLTQTLTLTQIHTHPPPHSHTHTHSHTHSHSHTHTHTHTHASCALYQKLREIREAFTWVPRVYLLQSATEQASLML